MNLNKIDPSLFSIGILENRLIDCVAFIDSLEGLESKIKSCKLFIRHKYSALGAVALEGKLENILNLSDLEVVRYISTVLQVSCLINRARVITNIDKLHLNGICGRGVGAAVIDTGCFPHLDFLLGRKKNITFVDFINDRTDMYDDNGHGTFVCGVLAGTGFSSAGLYVGVAPQSELIVLKALDENGKTHGYKVLEAFDWILANHKQKNIRVVCMSFGANPLTKFDALALGAEVLWDSGIVVVSAVGNDGPRNESIKSPAISSKIISVGSVDTSNGVKMADFSSRGPSFGVIKPDIVAPGVDVTSLDNSAQLFTKMTGTSVSAPFVAGVVCLLLSKYPELSPNEVKRRLFSSAIPLEFEPNECGMGLLNASNLFFDI